jgi:SAM-dependent methyltransferase
MLVLGPFHELEMAANRAYNAGQEDESFDLVLSTPVLDYVRDWVPVFAEFQRVLRPGGQLVFFLEHPFAKFDDFHTIGNYFETELVEYEWRGFGIPVRVPTYRCSLSAVLNSLLESGFTVERILEPVPTADFREEEPEDHEELIRRPGFMCVQAQGLCASCILT